MVVGPDTVALLFEPERPPQLRRPGERLTPGLLPSLRPVRVLVVNTAPVALDVTIDRLVSVDRQVIEGCVVRVVVQVSDADRHAALLTLAGEFGTELEAYLLQRVQNEVTVEVHAAVKLNRLADLRRLTLQQVLADRWLPRSFAGGALVRRSFAVQAVQWPPVAGERRRSQSLCRPRRRHRGEPPPRTWS